MRVGHETFASDLFESYHSFGDSHTQLCESLLLFFIKTSIFTKQK